MELSQQQINNFRDQLLVMRDGLLALSDDLAESGKTVELDQTLMGRLSRIDAMQGQQMAKETSRRREIELLAIGGALRRLESGDFGNCSVCDEEIDIRRLTVNPTSTRCIKCVED